MLIRRTCSDERNTFVGLRISELGQDTVLVTAPPFRDVADHPACPAGSRDTFLRRCPRTVDQYDVWILGRKQNVQQVLASEALFLTRLAHGATRVAAHAHFAPSLRCPLLAAHLAIVGPQDQGVELAIGCSLDTFLHPRIAVHQLENVTAADALHPVPRWGVGRVGFTPLALVRARRALFRLENRGDPIVLTRQTLQCERVILREFDVVSNPTKNPIRITHGTLLPKF